MGQKSELALIRSLAENTLEPTFVSLIRHSSVHLCVAYLLKSDSREVIILCVVIVVESPAEGVKLFQGGQECR